MLDRISIVLALIRAVVEITAISIYVRVKELEDWRREKENDAEPVRYGHWVRNDNGTYSCSECQSWIPNEQHYYARYCLYCGAKMDEEKENEIN